MCSVEPEAPGRGAARSTFGAALCLLLIVLGAPWWEENRITTIDGGWMAALGDAAAHGKIVGRDLYATYGWAFQQVALLARSLHELHSSVDSVALLGVLLWTLGGLALVAALVTIGPRDAAGMLVVCGVVAMTTRINPTWVRPTALVLIAALTTQALADPGTRRLVAKLTLLGAVAASLQLLALDSGAIAVGTVVGGALLVTLCETRQPPRQRLGRGLLLAGAGATGSILAALILTAALAGQGQEWFGPFRVAAELMRGYAPTHSTVWQIDPWVTVALGAQIVVTLVLVAREVRRSAQGARETLPLALAALASVRAIIVRSDTEHVSIGFVPLVFLFCRLALPALSPRLRRLTALFVVALTVIAQWNRLPATVEGSAVFTAPATRFQELRRLDLASRAFPRSAAVQAGDPAADLFVFPYDLQRGLVAGRRLDQTFVQSYQATTAGLDALAAHRLLAGHRPLEALVAEDGALDGVQAVTRNPAIFEALWRRFRLVATDRSAPWDRRQPVTLQMLLRRVDTARELPSQAIHRSVRGPRPTTSLVLSAPAACSLLRIVFELDYPWMASVTRRAAWQIEARRGELVVVQARVVALDAGRFETFVNLLPSADTAAIFRGDAPRRTFDRLDIASADRSLFAVQPRFVHLAAVDCLTP